MIATLAVIAFAALDGYYLAIERAYRSHYQAIGAGAVSDWDMTIRSPDTGAYFAAVLAGPNLLLYATSLAVTISVFSYLAAH